MSFDAQLKSSIISIANDRFGGELQALELGSTAVRRGLESRAVERIRVHGRDRNGSARSLRLVAKQLEGTSLREADVYRDLLRRLHARIAPDMFGVERLSSVGTILFLEDVRAATCWPWRDLSRSAAVLQQLASFHEASRELTAALPVWDYEAVLQESAVSTLHSLQQLRRHSEFCWVHRSLRSIDRLVSALPTRRAELLDFGPYESGPIHGDVHPGNVIMRGRGRGSRPVLIDWARARMGSPLEDVSSWLQTLAYWEPVARRRHDTLLRGYLRARGHECRISSELRAAYWMAAASNALAGALRYYCFQAEIAPNVASRARAMHAARDWMRMIERAYALSRR